MGETQKTLRRRRKPKQERARVTVDAIVEAAARVFRREGPSATTNRIAAEAGVSVGSLYEYFPNKESILLALAERHVQLAETGIGAVLAAGGSTEELLGGLQRAILESHRFPSQAVELVRDVPRLGPALLERVTSLRARVLSALRERATQAGHDDADVRATAAFSVLGELTARTLYLAPEQLQALAPQYLAMAVDRIGSAGNG